MVVVQRCIENLKVLETQNDTRRNGQLPKSPLIDKTTKMLWVEVVKGDQFFVFQNLEAKQKVSQNKVCIQTHLNKHQSAKKAPTGKPYSRVRLSSVYLLIKMGCFVKKYIYISV